MSNRPLSGWPGERNYGDSELGGSGGGNSGSNYGSPPHVAFRNANWLAHLFQPSRFAPSSVEYVEFLSNARNYLESLRHLRHPTIQTLGVRGLDDCKEFGHSFALLAPRIRNRFNVLPWRMLIVPSGSLAMKFTEESDMRWEQSGKLSEKLFDFLKYDKGPTTALYALDKALTSKELLNEIEPADAACGCLVIQLNSNLPKTIYIEDLFPLFGLALSNANAWPGALVWNLEDQATFLPLPRSVSKAKAAIAWIVSSVSAHELSASTLRSLYFESGFEPNSSAFVEPLTLIHMSDLHWATRPPTDDLQL